MSQSPPDRSMSRRRTQFMTLVVIVVVALAAAALVAWLALATGLEPWVFLLLVAAVAFIVLALAD